MQPYLIILLIIIIIVITVISFLYYYYETLINTEIVLISRVNKGYEYFHDKIVDFENQMSNWYDYGNDKFRIDHGKNYYNFFERMGHMSCYVAYNNNKIIGTGIGVRRSLNNGDHPIYICDVKIDKKYRGQYLLHRMILKAFMDHLSFRKSSYKYYGISMNKNGTDNYMVKIAKKFNKGFSHAGNLNIYTVNSEQMEKCREIIEKHKGSIYFRNLQGTKDLILKSTGERLNLWHVNLVKNKTNVIEDSNDVIDTKINENNTYMFCFHENDPVTDELKTNNIITNINASIVQYGLNNYEPVDYDFIQTSEI